MKKGNYLSTILRANKTVFSFKDIVLIWNEKNINSARSRINYYVKNKELIQLRRGFYAKDDKYDRYELASKICVPSYISFETVLKDSGMIFQRYGSIYIASYKTKDIMIDGQKYCFRTIKQELLTNSAGIINKNNYTIASVERAFLDILYLKKDFYFDNLSPINWKKVYAILPIYGNNKRMIKKVKEFELMAKQKIK